MPCWINGLPAEHLSVRDRGLAYGDGLFETITVRHGRARLLDRHLQRLIRGCQQLLIPIDEQQLRQEVSAYIALVADAVVKLIITRGEGQRGYALPQPQRPLRILTSSPLPAHPAANAEQGVSLFPCATRLAEQPLLAGIKHLNRLEQVLARAEWQDARYAEGLVRDCSGRVIEGVFSNLFMVRDGRLLTPDLSRCGIAGVMRAEIIDRAERLGLVASVRDIGYDELLTADELFICNSLYGIWPVRELAGHVWPVGKLTRTLQVNLQDILGD
ncbi:aminodeoxychorismate lyase [Pseudomonas sp. N040]|uniref:aminodeoxychorismate lyase n=1 Tax=Pseudomonas sp. N040 TaxID=2785325 RepID=UPI0018A2F796|nr:aminodeoxychorismate lyase [Pseudomonas sp. N040]MBF7731355.1 aminodeoxychorismate lyase [Pseudomonas sp. N040]MBW7014998.1 aminodeoxychorismate lyase [Pseudomonas sp. N040]